MSIIRRLETTPRRVYTGAMGFILPGGRVQFNVAIRTLLVDKRSGGGEYGVGSGVVWRSAPGAEYEECLTKSAVLTTHTPRFALIETMRWEEGRGIVLLDRHLQRLRESAEYFGYPFDRERVLAAVEESVHARRGGASRVRLLLNERGEPVADAAPAPEVPARWTLRLADRPLDSHERLLYHKTTHRAVYDEALSRMPGCDDVLLFNERGEATESCIANLIVDLGGTWYTPPLSAGVLPGVYRSFLLDEGRMVERVIPAGEVHSADRVLLCNALRGVWRAEIIP
jgi:para-aminobenzoate synthetase/4-amino-4-deoxychorismate lyase